MSEIIDSRFIDLDLSVVPQDQGSGLIEESESELLTAYADLPWYDELLADEMVPRSEWKARSEAVWPDLRKTVTEIYSQGSEGSCVGFGACQALETTLRRTYGLQHWVSLSGMSVYKRIGRSAGSGAMISDGMAAIAGDGALPVNSPENKARYQHTHPRTGFGNRLPDGWPTTGRLFRVTKAAKAQGADMVASALLKKRCGIVGRSRHCVPYVGLRFNGNSPTAAYANSWGNWGDQGFGYDSEGVFRSLVLYVILEVCTRPDLGIPELA